ncbi:ABC transporter permease [Pseudonocardia ailaonensis]|uniref:ABC transporter permease n=1 Tax=Pseudonocardia ailaonensis TaxID=367279 RepID=A0ABN2NB81_9PSEU
MTAVVTGAKPGTDSVLKARLVWAKDNVKVLVGQLLILAAFLVAWQQLPQIPFFSSRFHFLDPYFVSSPTAIASRLVDVLTGRNGSFTVWSYVQPTLLASLVGLVVGMVLGGVMGLVLSNSPFASALLRPFIVLLNAVPRIALIPIVIIAFGASLGAEIVISVLIVFFVVFWNAYEGGQSVPLRMSQNAQLLGAKKRQITWRIMAPYVLAWTLASLPNAVTFALLSVVTSEVLTGNNGLGFLITQSLSTADATLTFTTAVLLAIIGLIVVMAAEAGRKRVLHWWHPSR